MPVFRLDDRLVFPPVHLAEDGLLALGGDLRPERLLLGYTQGIFPWYAENLPILWHSPDPRMVLALTAVMVHGLSPQIPRPIVDDGGWMFIPHFSFPVLHSSLAHTTK